MNRTEQQFFVLLRSGLWHIPVDVTLFSGVTDWEGIYAHAVRQTVLGLVADGVNTLSADVQPPAPLLNKMRNLLASSIRSHALLNRTLAEVVVLLLRHDIHPVLLKGQGVALNYAEPTRRQCGDIDLYIGKQDYQRVCTIVQQCYGTDPHAIKSEKHYHFRHESGVTIELHRIAEQLPLPWHDHHFQRWTQEHLHGNHLRTVVIEGTTIHLPPVDFDVLYIFNHAWHHFSAGGGIGLRQLCDWARFLHTFRDEIDRQALRRNLKAFGLWRAWRIFGCVVVDGLGLHAAEFPFYTSRYARQAEQMLRMIGQGGNFGFFDPARTHRPEGYIAGKLHSFVWMHHRFGRLLGSHFLQVSAAWASYIYKGTKQVLIDQLNPKKP